jgi:pilus assembly protein CpaE
MLKKKAPDWPLVAVGTIAYPEGAVAALRAGINHFIDISAPADEARESVRKLLARAPAPAAPAFAHGAVTALLGARAGVGATTLAVHLSDILRRRKTAGQPECRVALLDLGFPTGDGQLYLNASGNFHFADIVRNLHRLDQTLIQTALTRSSNGVAVIPLPRAARDMSGLADADVLALLTQLRFYFDVVVMDLGGYPDAAFAARLAKAADRIWLLTDQSAGALVSLAALLAGLDKLGGNPGNRHLIVNRHDRHYGMSAPQIAERFGLPLAAAIPDRTLGLMGSANQGKLLHEVAGNDPYVRAVRVLADMLAHAPSEKRQAGAWSRWKRGFFSGH